MTSIRVMVVEDDDFWRNRLYEDLNAESDIVVVSAAKTRNEAIAAARETEPDVILMDINLTENRLDGLEATRDIVQARRGCVKVIMLTSLDSEEIVIQSFQHGADNFINKSSYADIVQAIREQHANKAGIHPDAGAAVKNEIRLMLLSPSEREVYELKKQGFTKMQISEKLQKSINTVKTQWKSIKDKLF